MLFKSVLYTNSFIIKTSLNKSYLSIAFRLQKSGEGSYKLIGQ